MHKTCGSFLSLYPGEQGVCVYVCTEASCCIVLCSEKMGKCPLPSREEWSHNGVTAQLENMRKS